MRKTLRTLIVGASAVIALGTLSACSGGSNTEATSAAPATSKAATSEATATLENFPASARYIADMPMADGKTMTLGVAVDGEKVVAYACDGSDDEAPLTELTRR